MPCGCGPSLGKKILHAAGAVRRAALAWVKGEHVFVTEAGMKDRFAICQTCPWYSPPDSQSGAQCLHEKCGCNLFDRPSILGRVPGKIRLATEHCPDQTPEHPQGRWP